MKSAPDGHGILPGLETGPAAHPPACSSPSQPDSGTLSLGLLTWTCLQSWPRAGSWMRRNVMGHFRDTLMAVCSTPSSPLRVVLPDEAATLLKFRLTVGRRHRWIRRAGLSRTPPTPSGG